MGRPRNPNCLSGAGERVYQNDIRLDAEQKSRLLDELRAKVYGKCRFQPGRRSSTTWR